MISAIMKTRRQLGRDQQQRIEIALHGCHAHNMTADHDDARLARLVMRDLEKENGLATPRTSELARYLLVLVGELATGGPVTVTIRFH